MDATQMSLETRSLDRLLTLQETAERLRKSEKALRWQMHQGTAPKSALIGGRRMFRTSDVESYIAAAFDEQVPA